MARNCKKELTGLIVCGTCMLLLSLLLVFCIQDRSGLLFWLLLTLAICAAAGTLAFAFRIRKIRAEALNWEVRHQRRIGAVLLCAALVLGLGSDLLGILYGAAFSAAGLKWVFWSASAIAALCFVCSAFLGIFYVHRISNKSVADMAAFILSHRDAALETAEGKLRVLRRIKVFTLIYTLLFVPLAFLCGFCGGALTDGGTELSIVVFWWSALLFLAALSRIRFPDAKIPPEEDPLAIRREDYPRLYQLARKAADSQGWQGDLLIRLTVECNAGVSLQGNTCCIYLGVILLHLLTPEELTAVFCHEFCHIMQEAATDADVRRYGQWLDQSGAEHFLSGLTSGFFAFPDALYTFHFELYQYSAALLAENNADQAMICLTDPQTAASALIKLKYNDLYEWELGTYDTDSIYAAPQLAPHFVQQQIRNLRNRICQRADIWNLLIDREILSIRATHPTAKMRLEALGVPTIPRLILPQKDSLQEEREKALSRAEQFAADQLQETYAFNRQSIYLDSLQTVQTWEQAGKPLDPQEYAGVVSALQNLGRNLEADGLCCRAMEAFSSAAGLFARFSHGSFLLHCYDDSGMDLLYEAIDGNLNYIEEGLDIIGQYCCLTGNREALEAYREKADRLLQKEKDVYYEMLYLSKSDRLSKETLPEELQNGLLACLASVDGGMIQAAYLVRKQITEEEFTSALVVRFREHCSQEQQEKIKDKLFAYLDTSTDWQFSLFDYEEVRRAKVEAIPGSKIYPQTDI